jgi:hypothetical protein
MLQHQRLVAFRTVDPNGDEPSFRAEEPVIAEVLAAGRHDRMLVAGGSAPELIEPGVRIDGVILPVPVAIHQDH